MSRRCAQSGGLDVSYETIRRWFVKFRTVIADNLRRSRPRSSDHWTLDEMVIVIRRKRYWLWRAVDNEGEVLDVLVQSRRNAKAAKKLIKKLLKKQGFAPSRIVTDKLHSYPAAFRAIGLVAEHDRALRANSADCMDILDDSVRGLGTQETGNLVSALPDTIGVEYCGAGCSRRLMGQIAR
jgi:transposase-like protein